MERLSFSCLLMIHSSPFAVSRVSRSCREGLVHVAVYPSLHHLVYLLVVLSIGIRYLDKSGDLTFKILHLVQLFNRQEVAEVSTFRNFARRLRLLYVHS